jgi:hypothetical protein
MFLAVKVSSRIGAITIAILFAYQISLVEYMYIYPHHLDPYPRPHRYNIRCDPVQTEYCTANGTPSTVEVYNEADTNSE